MKAKKSNKASLENKRTVHFIMGLLISLSLILISFEWTRSIDIRSDVERAVQIDYDEQIIDVIPREEEAPPKPELPSIMEVIDIVPDDWEVEDITFDIEVGPQTQYDIFIYKDEPEEIIEEDIPYIVSEMPMFNGGNANKEFARYISRNLKYPEIAAENGVWGRVIVQFDIDKTGKLVDPVIYKGIDPALDAEAIRVVSSSPLWTPGRQGTRTLKVRFVFPISFVLK